MSSSTLTYYSSGDASAPALTGTAGSLLALLDACLVNGYGSKTAAGWTKPFANSSNSGCYKQGAGCGFAVHINDNGANVSSTFKEAWMTGWEVITAVGTVGTGSGQFPLPAQLLTTGHVVIRKSNTADSTARPWCVYADASTFYLFTITGDNGTAYVASMFGDIFSLAGALDLWRCAVIGRPTENSADISTTTETMCCVVPLVTSGAQSAHYMPRSFGGGGTSVQVSKLSDTAKNANSTPSAICGTMATPNPADNSYYLAPIWISDASGFIRGRLRGLYQLCHPTANFVDGQAFQGANDYAGKYFRITRPTNVSGTAGMYCMETSATVETN